MTLTPEIEPQPRPRHVGLIGAGGIARPHLDAWIALGADVAVYAVEGSERLAEEYGIRRVSTLPELFEFADFVDICTPTPTHHELALAAIDAGLDVICEKPIARTVEHGRAIEAAASAAGVAIYPGHVVRFFPEYRAAKMAIDDGTIGRAAILRFARTGQAPAAGSWFYDEAQSGGIVMDQMLHDIDQAVWMAGPVFEVYATQNPMAVDGVLVAPISAQLALTHADGAISYIAGTWGPPGTVFRTSFELAGDRGVLSFDSLANPTVLTQLAEVESVSYLPSIGSNESPYLTELREFADAFAGGPKPRVSIADAIIAVGIAQAAEQSLASGLPVAIETMPAAGSRVFA